MNLSGDLRVDEVLDDDAAILFKGFDEELKRAGAVQFLNSVGSSWGDVDWFVGEFGGGITA